jgi:hypothetical protein
VKTVAVLVFVTLICARCETSPQTSPVQTGFVAIAEPPVAQLQAPVDKTAGDKTKKAEPTKTNSSRIDNSLAVGLAQAFATVFAVFVGFLLSIWADKRAWRRRKQEHLRERQVSALIGLLATGSNCLQIITQTLAILVQVCDDLAKSEKGSTSPAALALKSETLQTRMTGFSSALQDCLRDLELKVLELRLLRYSAHGIEALVAFLSSLRDAHALLRDLSVDAGRIDQQAFACKIADVQNKMTTIIESGVSYISG